jgi:hypothetical protein
VLAAPGPQMVHVHSLQYASARIEQHLRAWVPPRATAECKPQSVSRALHKSIAAYAPLARSTHMLACVPAQYYGVNVLSTAEGRRAQARVCAAQVKRNVDAQPAVLDNQCLSIVHWMPLCTFSASGLTKCAPFVEAACSNVGYLCE